MSQSLKLKDNNYWDSSGIVHNQVSLAKFLIDKLYTITKKINIMDINTWYDTGIEGEDLSTGTYIVEIFISSNSTNGQYRERASGIMAWYQNTTNSSNEDEIPLSKAGHARNNHNIKFRVLRMPTPGHLKLQISDTIVWHGECEVLFQFRKVI